MKVKSKVRRLVLAISVGITLISIMSATAFWLFLDYSKSPADPASASNRSIFASVTCRAGLFLQKWQGEMPDLSWTELWKFATARKRGFHCMQGQSVGASLQYTATASEGDRMEGARIFHERCVGCHGSDGSGGPYAPPLTRSEYKHGDNDFAIYKILRDGIPGTAMPRSGLSLDEILQVLANLNALRNHTATASRRTSDLPDSPRRAIQVSSERLQSAEEHPDEWLTYSGSYNGWRHTSLAELTPANVAQLRLRWIDQLDNVEKVIEATPLVIGGVIFLPTSASSATALDAKTGDVIWEYKRPIPANLATCCERVNRGLAAYGSTLFFGSLDGNLIALNANDGTVIWQTQVANATNGYSLTGAPLVVNHSVVVGVAGGDFGSPGFLAAYDVATGQQQWRFETVPPPGEAGHETWQNDAWRTGGGGTWNTGAYDPAADLLYWGVGNPGPAFQGEVRPGDNLYTESVVALHASTGKLAWYFQFTPHDEHNWDSAQTPILAGLSINNKVRNVICWPNRNGFYYILDRITGEFLSGVPYVDVNWTTGLTSSGRPILTDVGEVSTAGSHTRPGLEGATNWQNPAFDQKRGLVFVPATLSSSTFTRQSSNKVPHQPDRLFLGSGASDSESTRVVRALDAATGQRKWDYISRSPTAVRYNGAITTFGGLLSTEGGLVFGASAGYFFALDADTGAEVWRVSLGGITAAAPISFAVDGRQVILVAAGRALFMFGL